MTQYLMSVYIPEGYAPPAEEMAEIFRDVDGLNEKIKAEGAWVFGGGLHPPATATVVQAKGGDVLTTDGPYVEAKEHLGGFWIVEAPDLDAALGWARQATVACRAAIELRPFEDDAG